MKTGSAALIFGLVLVAGSAGAHTTIGIPTPRQAPMTRAEFETHLITDGTFGRYDANADGNVDEREFARTAFAAWDSNRDRKIDGTEFGKATARWTDTPLADWDADEDGILEFPEFRAGWSDTGWFMSWDANGNGRLSAGEFATGLSMVLDANGDRTIDRQERAHLGNGAHWMF